MINQRKHISRIVLHIVILWFNYINIYGQTSAQISIPFEVYDNAGGHYTLYFGLDQTATDVIDIHLGESELPPYPPTGVFEVRWFLPENNFNGSLSSWIDYRFASGFPYSGTKEHRLRFQSTEGATAIYFSWDFPLEVTGILQDVITGNIINSQLNGSGVYELTDFFIYNQLKLIITYNNIVTGLETNQHTPKEFRLNQNYPNPFNPNTVISYWLPVNSNVLLIVYDVLGNEVATLIDEEKQAGIYEVEFSAKGGSAFGGNAYNLPSGIYFYTLRVGAYFQTKKMVFLK